MHLIAFHDVLGFSSFVPANNQFSHNRKYTTLYLHFYVFRCNTNIGLACSWRSRKINYSTSAPIVVPVKLYSDAYKDKMQILSENKGCFLRSTERVYIVELIR